MKTEADNNRRKKCTGKKQKTRVTFIDFSFDTTKVRYPEISNKINIVMLNVVEIVTPNPYSVSDLCRVYKLFQYN